MTKIFGTGHVIITGGICSTLSFINEFFLSFILNHISKNFVNSFNFIISKSYFYNQIYWQIFVLMQPTFLLPPILTRF
ncbi:hypothetical protein GLOIN_2v1662252 [Rhizophagus irregularis DAOM 181602=DAOM 197198]|uniref:Uncharacterized protein n=1 Tax=Rhizophagus irregularis (strain DAOM 181602 / DAOM 197198 / MUCL 43194) TaxID=747089 RepID=A0A2P4PKL2_RHIID|nr:hypothetical protein GLOIN_2v1662252 [Rhizophagus irregularis DAOM 181602=DAOM 197198]POG65939.1 hypothetical protein GLOIN_2v1662252 [Rhizophagus irregularis DAOM 181602=DAOM 197198]GET49959.1 hypothetical protein GLOIN_2v1662252 [Rhizophagus irregularis DAOM 181602=DAOM 197198]|eukprot:XP_025172805.1 hypothetical protein GLOIN_2v1662252 [Rhizophagus irregularis DAOM 181602=DAOM 197198]